MDAIAFRDFLKTELISRCNDYPGLRSVIVMDNTALYYNTVSDTLLLGNRKKLCIENSLKLEYLPPYLPDFNPIQSLFSLIQKAMPPDRNITNDGGLVDFAKNLLEIAIKQTTPEIARHHFRYCYIQV